MCLDKFDGIILYIGNNNYVRVPFVSKGDTIYHELLSLCYLDVDQGKGFDVQRFSSFFIKYR